VRLGRSTYFLHCSTAAAKLAVARLPAWPPCWDLVLYDAAAEDDGGHAGRSNLLLHADVALDPSVDQAHHPVHAQVVDPGPDSPPRAEANGPPFPTPTHLFTLTEDAPIPYLRRPSAFPPSFSAPSAANPAGRGNDGEAPVEVDFPSCDVLSWPPSFSPTPLPDLAAASFFGGSLIQEHGRAARSPEETPSDRSFASTRLHASTPSPRSYMEALLSSPPLHRSPPTPRRLVFSPIKGKPLCFRCLSPEHGVGGCRDPLR
jgi:hypothetical protein